MKKLFIVLVVLLNMMSLSAQTASLSLNYGTDNPSLNQILSFENITVETLKLKSPDLQGKHYQIFVKEYLNGKFIKKDTLFDGSEAGMFNIASDSASFSFMSKTEGHKLKIQIQSPRFNSKKLLYDLRISEHDYALKTFFTKPQTDVAIGKPFYIFAIITPTIHKNGFGSYCEVAQSKGNPEDFGTTYNIPHYFLIEMVLK